MGAKRSYRAAKRMESAGGRGSFQRIWEAIRARREDFTPFLLHSDSGVAAGTIGNYLSALRRGGYIERLNQRHKAADQQHFKLVKDCGIEYPRLNANGTPNLRELGTEAIWRTMRIIGEFSVRELTNFASTPERPLSQDTVKLYVRHMVHAGYVVRTSAGRYRIVLAKYSGPRPPVVGKASYVYDPNLDKVVWEESVNHVDL